MKAFLLSLLVLSFSFIILQAQQVVVQRDNGSAGGVHNFPGREASVILEPEGPCKVLEIQIYFSTNMPATDTLWVVGDPAEGAIPPTSWVWSYNTVVPPFIISYDGSPGWKSYDVSEMDIRSDGYDRIVLQHRIDPNGMLWTVDNNAQVQPYRSFLMDPTQNNSLGIPGLYQLAGGDFMVRLVVEYDYPQGDGSAPPPAPTMIDVTESATLVGDDGEPVTSSRVSVADWNNDGWDDIAAGSRFWQNNGDGSFTKVDLGITASTSVWGDYDNDGDLDCYAARGGTNDDFLYRNDGDGTFTDVTSESGLSNPAPTVTPIWFDFDHDGDLDLFISNGRTGSFPNEIFYKDKLWLNDGDGTFTDVTDVVGIPSGEPDPNYDCWGAAPVDYNGDGWTDIFVATYRLAPDVLFKNNDGQNFTDVARSTGVVGEPTADQRYFGHGIGVEWADYNNDALIDLTVGNLGHPDWRGQVSNPSLVYRNNGDPNYQFTEVHNQLGLKFYELNAGVVWGDYDLDGNQDLFHCQYSYQKEGNGTTGEPGRLSRLYFNQGSNNNWQLVDKTWHTGLRIHGAWTAARLDYDRDGDLDLVVASPREKLTLYRNDLERKGNALSFQLVGDAEKGVANDGYGTRLTVYSGDQLYFRELQGGGSGATGTQNSNRLHFGVGDVATVDSLIVQWSDGMQQIFLNVETDREYKITYGNEVLEEIYSYTLSVDNNSVHEALNGERAVADIRYEGGVLTYNLLVTDQLYVEIANGLGEIVFQKEVSEARQGGQEIVLPETLPSGLYIVQFHAGEIQQTVKLTVVE